MTVNQGLKSFAESSPEFTNQGISNLINVVNTGWVAKNRLLAQKIDASTVITDSQRNDLADDLATHEYLNLGRVLEDLSLHTPKIFTGELGEQDPNSDEANRGSFVDHIQSVQGFIGTVPFLYGYTADSINKGVAGHFGTVSGSLDSAMETLRESVVRITKAELTTDTALQTALTNLNNFLDTLDGSTDANNTSYNNLRAAYVTAANNFNTALENGAYDTFRENIITARKIVVDQIALEVSNLGVIRTFEAQLADISSYVNMATDPDVRNLMIRTSNNKKFVEYFENFAHRDGLLNPLFQTSDSSIEQQVKDMLSLQGLPDVTDPLDLDSVANKATRDSRLITTVSFQGKTTEEIINLACDFLKITKGGKNIYGLSESLLDNMNNHDITIIKNQITANQEVDTLN